MTMDKLVQLTRIGFSTTFSFYTKVHSFHWNVEGSDFYEYHKLFEDIYTEVYGAIDPYAENVRKLGGYMPTSYHTLSMLTKIEDEDRVPSKDEMIQELLQDSERIQIVLKKNYDAAEAAGEHGLSNFLAERMDNHKKHAWFLRASLKGE
jgi:starvation-inducible DNA-binding protein